MKLSVCIISFNEELNIARTLKPLQGLADEIIVLDSFSTDKTVEIASTMGAKVYKEEWAGFIAQKNSALEKCTGEWVLSLDSDEVLTPEVVESIKAALDGPQDINGYVIKRRTVYMGRLLKYAWQPDKHLRMVRRSAGPRWGGTDPHESLQVQGKSAELEGFVLHYSYRDFAAHMATTQKYAHGAAKTYYAKGKKARRRDFLLRPPFALFKRLIIQQGLRDGVPGIIAGFSTALYTYMKYAFLWEMQNKKPE
ncbi:glycosyltransferase family 2 protein [Desulfovibrio sp. OttesenSCG-928-F07]|nr:glycosyltransferase family 2 protein [Desulfovibrio sp. OttesenSCG-928-F07]